MRIAKPKVTTVDFETEEIQPRPVYPPVPVGVAIRHKTGKTEYLAWGHPSHNNTTKEKARRILADLWKKDYLLFHNSKFDVDVAEVHLGLKVPNWNKVHDTMFLLFLYNPHAWSLELKKLAEEHLDMPPEEQQTLRQWLMDNKIVRKNDKRWGAKIAAAPGRLVAPYAKGDVIRTYKLFQKFFAIIEERGMMEAYDRERQIMPILLRNEQQGIRVDVNALRKDIKTYRAEFNRVDKYLAKRLDVPLSVDPNELNMDSDKQVADRLDYLGIVTEWSLTPKGQKSMAKKNLRLNMFHDKKVAMAYAYRTRLQTCLSTFMEPWLLTAEQTGGLIHTIWNQVRQSKDGAGGFVGARTGRLSSTPNLMNIPTSFIGKDDGYEHPKTPKDVVPLPLIRRYVLPDKGHVFGHRDYNQQELRILAYFEDADLYHAYVEDMAVDIHSFVQSMLQKIGGVDLQRKLVKILNFGMIYGMGIQELANRLQMMYDEAKAIKTAHREVLPGLKQLERDIKQIGRSGECITTWGGRQYFTEPGRIINGRMQDFSYKLLNYLIQGSASDCTKQGIINYDDALRQQLHLFQLIPV